MMNELGDEYEKPVCQFPARLTQTDILQWLMDCATGIEAETDHLVARIQVLNFASIHTTLLVRPPAAPPFFWELYLIVDIHSCFI